MNRIKLHLDDINDDEPDAELARRAGYMDAIIVAFAIGVICGMLAQAFA